MSIWALALIVYWVIALCISLSWVGRTITINGLVLLPLIIVTGLLIGGGFFAVWSWPQWFVAIGLGFSSLSSFFLIGRQSYTNVATWISSMFFFAIGAGLIYAGGFFDPKPNLPTWKSLTSGITIQLTTNAPTATVGNTVEKQ